MHTSNTYGFSLGKWLALFVFLFAGQAVWADVWDGVTKTPAKMQKIDGKDYFLIETAANLAWFSDTVNQIVRDTKWNAMIEAINKDASNKDKKSTLELMEKIKQDPEAYYTDPEKRAEWYKAPDTNYLKVAWGQDNIPVEINAKITAEYLDMNNKPFTPIAAGNGPARFAGVFEGNGVPIKNLRVDSKEFAVQFYDVWVGYPSYCQNVGLFGVIGSGGVVRNVVLDNVVIMATGKNDFWKNTNQVSVGPIAGWVNDGTIDTCFVSGTVITNGRDVGAGGIAGAMNDGHIKDALSTVSIEASGKDVYVGGVVGVLKVKSSISTSVYDGDNLVAHPDDKGARGALVGKVHSGTHELGVCFYDSDDHDSPVGTKNSGVTVKDTVYAVTEINTAENACILNRHEWSGGIYQSSCKNEEGNDDETGVWANDISSIVNNGVGRDDNAETEYMITFDANGGGFYVDKVNKMLKFNSPLTTDDVLEPYWGYVDNKKLYKKFDGWSLSKTAKMGQADLGLVYGATTVYAVWVDVPVYTITFDFNGSGDMPLETIVLEGGAITLDDFSVNLLPSTYQANGKKYYFKGWSASKNGTKIDDFGVATKSTTFYAIWGESPSYKVTYMMRGHGVSPDVEIVSEGKSATVPDDPSAADYIFDGWYTDTTFKSLYDFNTVLSKDVVLYAKWVPVSYSIVYNINGGMNSADNPMTYTVEDDVVFKAPSTADSLEFKGWFFDGAFSQKADRIMPGTKTGNIALYAKWGAKTYVISYSAGQYGTGNVEPVVKAHGFPVILQGESYQRKGYVQDGWSVKDCKEGCNKNYDLWDVYEANSSVVLYPHWVAGSTPTVISVDTNRVTVYVVGRKGVYTYNGQEQVLSGYEIFVDNLRYPVDDISFSGDSVVKGTKVGVYGMGLDASNFKNNNLKFDVTFKVTDGFLRIASPFVVAKYNDAGDTLHVVVDENDSESRISEKINKALDRHAPPIPAPTKKAEGDSVFVLQGWKKNPASGLYEPVFKGLVLASPYKFRINFHLPEGAELREEFDGYVFGEVTLLPDAVMVEDETWVFKGWYTKTKGRGDRIKAMREFDYGNKSLYPFFQKTVRYDANGDTGEIEIIYTDRADIDVERALFSVIPADYVENGKTYTFDKWEIEDDVYVAKFKVVGNGFAVFPYSRTLVVENVSAGANLVVFDMEGRVVKRGTASNGLLRIEFPKPGCYTIRVDRKSMQVNIK